MGKKTIAVIVGTNEVFFRTHALDGIVNQANALGYNVAVLFAFSMSEDEVKHQHGEENLYHLIHDDNIVGVIIVEYSFWTARSKEKVLRYLESLTDLNAVILDKSSDAPYVGISPDDRIGFRDAVNHLIKKHGLKKICCLTGFKNVGVAEDRLQGYKDAMIENGLEIPDEYCIYGDFWLNAAEKLAVDIVEGRIARPEAVVCGNDFSAIALINKLIKLGVSVPKDIAVIGYDFEQDAMTNIPSVTTYDRSNRYAGAYSVCYLHKKATGEDVVPVEENIGKLIIGESCGCRRDISSSYIYSEHDKKYRSGDDNYRLSRILEYFMSAENIGELFDNIGKRVHMIHDLHTYAICLNSSWNMFREDDKEYIRDGYEDEMTATVFYSDGSRKENISFMSEELFPAVLYEDDKPLFAYFNALHFGDRCFGYEIITFNNNDTLPEMLYHLWTSSVSSSLEHIRMRQRMEIMYNRVFSSSVRDPMTGLYNRQALTLYAGDVFETAKADNKRLLIIATDLDGLKVINDKYGHSEGDNAISTVARALQACAGNGEYCIRTGGDEFLMIGCYDYSDEIIGYYLSRINGYLSRYNRTSKKPYKVCASSGAFLDYIDNYSGLDECLEIADKRMYETKKASKTARESE